MSLAGLRDISVIETPPEGRRPVRTYVGPYDEELVGEAIKREVAPRRPGLLPPQPDRHAPRHRRAAARRSSPRRSSSRRTASSTRASSRRRCSPSCAATPTCSSRRRSSSRASTSPPRTRSSSSAPTTLGLAQAYQIRGRVGRSRERAYAYMLYPSEEGVTREAAARLATLADHTELGSGFRIAMRDLELRGAGDLLGAEQSGHVAAIGFELYVEMLDAGGRRAARGRARASEERTEEEVRVDTDVSAFVPSAYVPYEAAKIDVHRRIAARPRARRAAGAARRAPRPLRPAAGAGRGAARRPAGADRARPRGRPQPVAARRADPGRAARARIRPRRPDPRADSRGGLTPRGRQR